MIKLLIKRMRSGGKMKIIHTADLHLGKIVNGYSLLTDQRAILNQIIEIAEVNNVRAVMISGDVYDKAIPSIDAMTLFEDFLFSLAVKQKIDVFIISGNHDQSARLTNYSKLLNPRIHFSNPLEEEIKKVEIEDCCFYLLPYTSLYQFRYRYDIHFSNTEEAYQHVVNSLILDSSKRNIILAHDYFTYNMEKLIQSDSEREISIGGSEYVDVSIFDKFDYVALGHMHQAQKVKKETIRYSGSVLKYSFSEVKHKKSLVVLDTDGMKVELKDLEPIRDLVVLKERFEVLIDPLFYSKYRYKEDFFKLIIVNPEDILDAFNKLKRIYLHLMEIEKVVVEKSLEQRNIKKHVSLINGVESFYQDVCQKKLDKEEIGIINQLLKKG